MPPRKIDETDYKIRSTYEATQTHEFSVDWNVCTEAREPSEVAYNATKLAQTHIHDIAPMYMAQAINEH